MERELPGLIAAPLSPAALIGTRDPQILEILEQQAAGAGLVVWEASSPEELVRLWGRAAVVLLDPLVAAELRAFAPARRSQVVLVCADRPSDREFRVGFELGAEALAQVVDDAQWLSEFLITAADPPSSPGRLVAVIGGSGGAGASTLVAALAQAAARGGERAAVLDLDPRGAGLDRILGCEELGGARWSTLRGTSGRLSPAALRASLPEQDGVSCVSWDDEQGPGERDPRTVREVLRAARAGHDWVFLDLPREADPLIGELAARCDRVLMVVQPDFTGLSAAARLLADGSLSHPLHLVVRRHRGALDGAAVSRVLGQPALVELPECRQLQESIALQQGPLGGRVGRRSNYARAVFSLVARLSDGQVAA